MGFNPWLEKISKAPPLPALPKAGRGRDQLRSFVPCVSPMAIHSNTLSGLKRIAKYSHL